MTEGPGEQTETEQRLTVSETADALGISSEAVRTRIQRGTLRSVREGGRVFVLFDADRTSSDADRTSDRLRSDATALISEMRAHNETLREQLEAERQAHAEARRIIAGLVERIPALEPPSEPRESPQTPAPDAPSTSGPPEAQEPAEPRPWWRRMFGA